MNIQQLSKLILGLNFLWVFFSQPVFSQETSTKTTEPEQPVKQVPSSKKGSDSTFRLGEVEVRTSKKGKISTKDVLTSVDESVKV